MRRILSACVLLLLGARPFVGAQAQAQAQATGSSYEAVGDSLYADFLNLEALEAYRAALRSTEPTFALMMSLARAANDAAQDAEAGGNEAEAQTLYDEAVEYSHRLTESHPERAGSWFMLAATTGKLAQFRGGKEKVRIGRDVQEYYQRSLAIDSTYAFSYLVGGIFNRELAQLNWVQRLVANTLFGGLPEGSLEVSKAMLRRAIELQKDLLTAHWELAQTCFAMDRKDEALAHVRFIASLQPRNSEEKRLKIRAAALLSRESS